MTVARGAGGAIKLVVWENEQRGEHQGTQLLRLAGKATDAGNGTQPSVIRVGATSTAGDFITTQLDSASDLQLATWRVGDL